jgi:manganese transport protein
MVRGVWMLILFTGFIFGFSGVKPIPVILAVQALNGFVLPLLAYFLILLVNDKQVIPSANQHGLAYNLILILIFGVTLLIGLNNVDKAITTGFQLSTNHFEIVLIVTVFALAHLGFHLWKIKRL